MTESNTSYIRVQLSPEQFTAAKQAARAKGLKPAQWVRTLSLASCPGTDPQESVRRLLTEPSEKQKVASYFRAKYPDLVSPDGAAVVADAWFNNFVPCIRTPEHVEQAEDELIAVLRYSRQRADERKSGARPQSGTN